MPKAKSHASSTKRQRWTRGQARAVLEKQPSSGLTVREFAEREGLESARLYRWRERLGVGGNQQLAVSAVGRAKGPKVATDNRRFLALRAGARS